jgi:hypothetical protein
MKSTIDMSDVFGLNYFVFCILVLVAVMYFTRQIRDEAFEEEKKETFGTSPGTMDQLSSTRAPFTNPPKDVNARPDQELEDHIQKNLTTKALTDLTESGTYHSDFAPV